MLLNTFDSTRAFGARAVDDQTLCLLTNMRMQFDLYDDAKDNRWKMPIIADDYAKMHRGDVLKALSKSNQFKQGHGRVFYWPYADMAVLERAAGAEGYTLSTRAPTTINFDFKEGVMSPYQNTTTAKAVRCIPTYFVKTHAAARSIGEEAGYLRDVDLLIVGEDVATELGGDLHAAGVKSVRGNHALQGMALLLAGRQYNLWCKALYGVEPLIVDLHPASGRPHVTRVSDERPLPEWNRNTWGARRARTGVFMKECAIKTGFAMVSLPQLNTLRAGLYTNEGAGNYMCNVEGRAILHIDGDKQKLKKEPGQNVTHKVLLTMIKVVKKTAD